MTDQERFEQLADLVLDGAATDAERSELAAILAADPAARLQYSELETLFVDLRSMRRWAAPPDLLPSTLSAIDAASPKLRRAGWLERLTSWLAPRPAVRYGAAFAAGIAVTALFLTGIRSGNPESDSTVGSMMPGAREIAPVRLALPSGTVEATLEPKGDLWILHVQSDLHGSASLSIDHDQRLRAIEPPSGASGDFAPGTASFILGGRTSVRLTLEPASGTSSPLRLLLASGSDSAQAVLEIPAAPKSAH